MSIGVYLFQIISFSNTPQILFWTDDQYFHDTNHIIFNAVLFFDMLLRLFLYYMVTSRAMKFLTMLFFPFTLAIF